MKNREHIEIDSNKVFCSISRASSRDIPILFVHGLGSAGSDYEGAFLRSDLTERTIIVPDLIGCGDSDKPGAFSYDLRDQAKVLDSLLEQLGYPCADLAAHSMGGVIAILLARDFPNRVRRLIAAEPNLVPENAQISRRIVDYGSEEAFADHFDAFIERFNRPENESAYRFYNTLIQTTPLALYRSAYSLLSVANGSVYQDFLELGMPCDFLKAEKSWQVISEQQQMEFSDHGIGFHIVPGAGHGMMGDNPQGYYDVLETILNKPID